MKIKNILFDMGGVVFIQDTAESVRRFSHLGLDTARYMGDYGQKEFFLDVETGAIDDNEFCRRMAQAAGRESVSWEVAQYCWLGYVKEVPEERLKWLLELRKDYHVCLLSNTNPFIMSYMRSEAFSRQGKPISDYFDTLFCSYEMGVCKPGAEIFQKALAQDGMSPDETVFVDDSKRNVEAARQLGIHGLHVKTNDDWMTSLQVMLMNI